MSVASRAAHAARTRATPAAFAQDRGHTLNASPRERDSTADTVAGFMAATAVFVGAIALAVRPLPLSVAAVVLSLVATAMSGPHSARLAAISVAAATVSFVAAMTIAVLTDRALF